MSAAGPRLVNPPAVPTSDYARTEQQPGGKQQDGRSLWNSRGLSVPLTAIKKREGTEIVRDREACGKHIQIGQEAVLRPVEDKRSPKDIRDQGVGQAKNGVARKCNIQNAGVP